MGSWWTGLDLAGDTIEVVRRACTVWLALKRCKQSPALFEPHYFACDHWTRHDTIEMVRAMKLYNREHKEKKNFGERVPSHHRLTLGIGTSSILSII